MSKKSKSAKGSDSKPRNLVAKHASINRSSVQVDRKKEEAKSPTLIPEEHGLGIINVEEELIWNLEHE